MHRIWKIVFLMFVFVGCVSKRTYIYQKSTINLLFTEIRFQGDSFEAYGGDDQRALSSAGKFEDRDSILVFTREKRSNLRYQDSVVFLKPKEKGISIIGINNSNDYIGFRPQYGFPKPDMPGLYVVAAIGDSFQISIPEDSVSVLVNILYRKSFQKFFTKPGVYQAVWDLETFGTDYILDSGSFEYEVISRKRDTIFVKSGRNKSDTSRFVRVRDERKEAPLHELWRYRKYTKPK